MDQIEKLTVKQFIGEDVCRQYGYAYPTMRLLMERVAFGIEDEMRLYWLLFSNNGPSLFSSGSIDLLLKNIAYMPSYLINKYTIRSRVPDKILVSDTLLLSDRYSFFQQECVKNVRIAGLSLLYNHYSLAGHKGIKYNRCVSLGKYVIDPITIKQILIVYDLMRKAYLDRKACVEVPGYITGVKTLDDLLAKRVEQIKKELLRNGISQYITCNQYRIEEIVIIEACRELGIATKEWSHHSMCTFDIHLYETPDDSFITDRENFYIFTDYFCCWNKGDVNWISKYGHVEPVFGQDIKYPAVGSPELYADMVVDDGGEERDHICYLVLTHYDDGRHDEEIYEAHYRILDELYTLSQRTGLKVFVRYHPSEYASRTDREMELYERYGFELLDSSRESLDRMYKSSKVCISSGTSALILSYNYGLRTYSVDVEAKGTFDYTGTPIIQIGIDDIAELDLEGDGSEPERDTMDLEALYRV